MGTTTSLISAGLARISQSSGLGTEKVLFTRIEGSRRQEKQMVWDSRSVVGTTTPVPLAKGM